MARNKFTGPPGIPALGTVTPLCRRHQQANLSSCTKLILMTPMISCLKTLDTKVKKVQETHLEKFGSQISLKQMNSNLKSSTKRSTTMSTKMTKTSSIRILLASLSCVCSKATGKGSLSQRKSKRRSCFRLQRFQLFKGHLCTSYWNTWSQRASST